MPTTEVIYADGSMSTFTDGGGFHSGEYAMMRVRLLMVKSALDVYIRTEGRMQVTRNGAQMAIKNVLEPMTGKKYKRSMNGKREALADCEAILAQLEAPAVVVTTDDAS